MAAPIINSVVSIAAKVTPPFVKSWYLNKLTSRLAKYGACATVVSRCGVAEQALPSAHRRPLPDIFLFAPGGPSRQRSPPVGACCVDRPWRYLLLLLPKAIVSLWLSSCRIELHTFGALLQQRVGTCGRCHRCCQILSGGGALTPPLGLHARYSRPAVDASAVLFASRVAERACACALAVLTLAALLQTRSSSRLLLCVVGV